MEKELKKVEVLETEKLSLEEIKGIIKILVYHLTVNSIKILKDTKGNYCEIKDDSTYCCIYFKIKGYTQQQKELALVFNKENYSVTVGNFVFKKEQIEVGVKKEVVKIPPLILPDVIAVFNFETIKSFSDNFFEISQNLH